MAGMPGNGASPAGGVPGSGNSYPSQRNWQRLEKTETVPGGGGSGLRGPAQVSPSQPPDSSRAPSSPPGCFPPGCLEACGMGLD